MAEKSTFIKLDRNIMKWRWYQNGNTVRVFLHLLLNANVVPHDFENITIKRGALATSYESLANSLNLSIQEVRTALGHLKSTGTITSKKYRRFQVITIVNYSYYQGQSTVTGSVYQHSSNSLSTFNQQQYKNIKNDKNEKNIYSPSEKKNSTPDLAKEGLWL